MIKGLNCCTVFFDNLRNGNELIGVFDTIKPYYKKGAPTINLCIAIFISGMFSRKDIIIDTDFKHNCQYDVLIHLKYASSSMGVILEQYSFSTNNTDEIEIFNDKRIIEIGNCHLPCGLGEYRIQILIKEHISSDWSLQYENGFVVTNTI